MRSLCPRRGTSPHLAGPHLRLPGSRAMNNKFLFENYPVCDVLLQQPEGTKTGDNVLGRVDSMSARIGAKKATWRVCL